ncbi:MAG: hypothetical protein D6737_01595 [Chloroflexi bacterium]|nr:MAG: hypothetical protein CUN54_04940 [Phototrophicales bacterium]RMF82491.1 MAG: hypothetical protein D6737_01595 [Chloroflexota bacterium]
MKNLRRWRLTSASIPVFELAADARLSKTDYTDDQIWVLSPGTLDSSALTLQTRYGGRATTATLIPHWHHQGRDIHLTQGYAQPPVVTAFAPGYIQLQAKLTKELALQAEYWVMESHAIGARYIIANDGAEATQLRLAMAVHVEVNDRLLHQTKLRHPDGSHGLLLGRVGNINPVIVLENADAPTIPTPSQIERAMIVPGKKKMVVRWSHAGLPDAHRSLRLALHWLQQDWAAAFNKIDQAAQSIPMIETGDADRDLALALSYQQLLQSFHRPTSHFPAPSFVATRQPDDGYSNRDDGRDYPRTWNGQDPQLAYLTALAIAPIDAAIAQGIIRNYLAVQQEDGLIDWKPGLGGQRRGFACLPILARLTWEIYQYTNDKQFLADAFPAIFDFFQNWLDDDIDRDDLPEWADERQTGYAFMPTFATTQSWAQGADIRYVETPDMAAYLLSEAHSLMNIADELNIQSLRPQLQRIVDTLEHILESLWHKDHYAYRDYETHTTTESVPILEDMPGDEAYQPQQALHPPARLVIHITGGRSHIPRCKLIFQGLDQHGNTVDEVSDGESLHWNHGHGFYTTRSVFSRINTIHLEGLSRVYKINVNTIDLTRLDINTLSPIWIKNLPQERADALKKLMTDPAHFWRQNGVAMTSAQDDAFDPSNADGSGAVWLFWQTILGEGLLTHNAHTHAFELLENLLAMLIDVYNEQGAFCEFYHADAPEGLGTPGHLAGIIPLHLFLKTIGVCAITPQYVHAGGPYSWQQPVTIKQHGITVTRSKTGTIVVFPSGHTITYNDDKIHRIEAPTTQPSAVSNTQATRDTPDEASDQE